MVGAADGSFAIDVADPCSGLRSLFALMALTAGYAYFTQPTWLRRGILFAASVPIAILGNVARILSIVNANVEITNNYARVAELPPGEEDFSAVVAEAVELFSAVADMKGVSLSLETPSSPVVLAAHRHKLQQLAGNLIDNAIKFTPSGGNVTVSLSETRDSVIFKVTDSGVGIAKSDLPKIYDRFFRAERSRDTPGSGLGLSLVRAIVTFYDGDIDCKSKPDSGTVFAVTIPKRK